MLANYKSILMCISMYSYVHICMQLGRELQGLEPRARRGLQGWMGDKRSRDPRAKETYTEARFLRNSHKKQISIAFMGGAILFQLERRCCDPHPPFPCPSFAEMTLLAPGTQLPSWGEASVGL